MVRKRSVQNGTFSDRVRKWSANQNVVNSTFMNRVGRVNPCISISIFIYLNMTTYLVIQDFRRLGATGSNIPDALSCFVVAVFRSPPNSIVESCRTCFKPPSNLSCRCFYTIRMC